MKRGQNLFFFTFKAGCTIHHSYVVICAPHKNDRAHTIGPSNQIHISKKIEKAISKKAMKKKQ